MWNKGKPLALGIILIILIIYLGFFRDFLFKNINYYIKLSYYNLEQDHYPWLYSILDALTISQVVILKWMLTFLFMVVNYLLSVAILKSIFKNSQLLVRLITYAYILLFIIAGVFYIFGVFLNFQELGYTLSRRFMGVLQSPVPLMITAAAHLIFGSTSDDKQLSD